MLQYIDYFSYVLEIGNGDYAFVVQLANCLLDAFSEENIKQLTELIEQRSGYTLSRKAHLLKSAALNFNMDAAVASLLQLEQAGKNNSYEGIKHTVSVLKTEIDQFRTALEDFRSKVR